MKNACKDAIVKYKKINVGSRAIEADSQLFYFNALGEYAMKLFTQLALVTAVASCGSAYAMQSMDDAALSSTTGQDGITILIAPPTIAGGVTTTGDTLTRTNGLVIGAAVLHDKDGFAGSLGGGAIILGDAHQANTANAVGTQMGIYGSGAIAVTIDASNGQAATGTGGTAPVLNVNVALPADLLIRTGDISIDGSNRAGIATGAAAATAANAATGGTDGHAIRILKSMDIALGGSTMNIQLGNTPQGAMIKAGGTIAGGLSISGLSLHDGNSALPTVYQGDLGVSMLTIKDTGAANLTISSSIDVTSNVGGLLTALNGGTVAQQVANSTQGGLVVTVGGNASDIMMQNVTLGSSGSTLGDLQLINVQLAGSHIAIMGH